MNKNQFSSLQPQNDLRIVEVGLKSIEVNFTSLKKVKFPNKTKTHLVHKKVRNFQSALYNK